MLDSIMTLISKYDVGENKTHFAIVTYAFNAEVRVSLDDVKYHSQEALREGIEEMKAKDKLIHRTRTDKALKKVCDEVFVPEKGDRPESPNVLILFTDGGTRKTSAPYGTVLPACEVRNQAVHPYLSNKVPLSFRVPLLKRRCRDIFGNSINIKAFILHTN